VSQHAVRDLQIKESINVLHPAEIAYLLTNSLGNYDAWVVGRFDVGEVLSDAYARGTQQKLEALV
jgi:hypothetical protein